MLCGFLGACSGRNASPPDKADSFIPTSTTNVVVANEPTDTASPSLASGPLHTAAEDAEPLTYNEYSVTADIDPETRMVTGIEKITYKNRAGIPLDRIYINLYLNAFSGGASYQPYFDSFAPRIFPEGARDYGYMVIGGITADNQTAEFTVSETVLAVSLPQSLAPEEIIEITLHFEAYVPLINHRTGANEDAMWFGNFLPTLAVYDETGWHTEPYYPAGEPFYTRISNYTVKVTTPSSYSVVGTGEESFTEADGKRQTTMTAKMVRDFAFVICRNYKAQTVRTNSGIDINVYTHSEIRDINNLLVIALKSVDYYGELLGTYPYASLDIVEAGLFMKSGMAYPEIIFMDSEQLQSLDYSEDLAHQIGHQWFYNTVGNNQIKEAWLGEGLTSMLQQGILYDDNQIRARMQRDYDTLQQTLRTAENKTLLQDLSVYKDWLSYQNIHYTRAELMIYSLSQKMGPEAFRQFMKSYYTAFSFKTATRKDFIAAAEAYGGDLTDFFRDWMENYELPPLVDTGP